MVEVYKKCRREMMPTFMLFKNKGWLYFIKILFAILSMVKVMLMLHASPNPLNRTEQTK